MFKNKNEYNEHVNTISCFKTDNSYWNGKRSDSSYSFVYDNNQPHETLSNKNKAEKRKIISNYTNYALRTLTETFDLTKDDINVLKNRLLVGEGCEWKKIRAIHSSSLCGFLHFKNVSKTNPVFINGNKYTKAIFESENKCIDNNSSVDLLLLNEDTKDVLFAELKFSEYLTGDSPKFSIKYLPHYKKIFGIKNLENDVKNGREVNLFENVYLRRVKETDDEIEMFLKDSKKGDSVYLGGIKQCVSHFIGINNFKNGFKNIDINFKPNKLNYVEIIYKFDNKKYNAFDEYYSELILKLEKYFGITAIKSNEGTSVVSYQEIFANKKNRKLLNSKTLKLYY